MSTEKEGSSANLIHVIILTITFSKPPFPQIETMNKDINYPEDKIIILE